MSHELFRLTSSIHNTPLLMTRFSFESVLSILEQRNKTGNFGSILSDITATEERFNTQVGVGILQVVGALTYRDIETDCGGVSTSYESLIEDLSEFAGSGVRTVVMLVDSGGGESIHCFETARELRSIADEHGIKLIGYIDTNAQSAAYALISCCDYIVSNNSGSIGSIGVLVALKDESEANRLEGIKYIYVVAGKDKVPFAEDGSFKRSFIDNIQLKIDKTWDEFITLVSSNRGISYDSIKSMEAGTFDADEALKLGLIDAIMTNREFTEFVKKVKNEQ